MSFTRRQWLGASAASILGAVTAGMKLSPLAQAMAATELSPAAQLAALKAFSGTVAHATHYGPLMATVQKGRIVKIDAQASDKMPTAMLTKACWIAPTIRPVSLVPWYENRIWNGSKAAARAATSPSFVAKTSGCR